MQRPLLLLACLCGLASLGEPGFTYIRNRYVGLSWQSSCYKSPSHHLKKTEYCGAYRGMNRFEVSTLKDSEDDHGYHWVYVSLGGAKFVSGVGVQIVLDNFLLPDDYADFSESTEVFVANGVWITEHMNHCSNRMIWKVFTDRNTVTDNFAFKRCGNFSKVSNVAGEFDRRWRMVECGHIANYLLLRVKNGSYLQFYDLGYYDYNQAFLGRISKRNTQKVWHSSSLVESCWHRRDAEELDATFSTPRFIHSPKADATDSHWFAALLEKPRLVGEVWLTAPNNRKSYFENMGHVEVWASPGSVDFGNSYCSADTFATVMNSLSSERSPKLFTMCDRRTENFADGETWKARCDKWIYTIVVRMQTNELMVFTEFSIFDAYDFGHLFYHPYAENPRVGPSFTKNWQSSSSSQKTCMAEWRDKRGDGQFVLQMDPEKGIESGFHWFAMKLWKHQPSSYITLADPLNTAENAEFYTSGRSLDFGPSSCNASGWSRLFAERTSSELPEEERLRPCDDKPFRVGKWIYVLCHRWIHSVLVRVPSSKVRVPSLENVAVLPSFLKVDRITIEHEDGSSALLKLHVPTMADVYVECPNCPEQPIVESPNYQYDHFTVNFKNLKPKSEYRIVIRGRNKFFRLKGETEFSFKTGSPPPYRKRVNSLTDTAATLVFFPEFSYTVECPSCPEQPTVRGNEASFAGLLPAKEYRVVVRGEDTGSSGLARGAEFTFKTRTTPPTNIRMARVMENCFTLTWSSKPDPKVSFSWRCPLQNDEHRSIESRATCCSLPLASNFNVTIKAQREFFPASHATVVARTAAVRLPTNVLGMLNGTCASFSWMPSVDPKASHVLECPHGETDSEATDSGATCCGLSEGQRNKFALTVAVGAASERLRFSMRLPEQTEVSEDKMIEVMRGEDF